MTRRFLISSLAFGAVAVISYPAYKWLGLKNEPDLTILQHRKTLICELAETIIPETETPGAKAAVVESFIIKMIQECTDVKSQNNFLLGLSDVEDYCHSKFYCSFTLCNSNQKQVVLAHFEEQSKTFTGILEKVQRKLLGKPFFNILKDLTVQGYCTSKLGATQGLAYDYIPQTFEGCIPLKPSQKSWATQ